MSEKDIPRTFQESPYLKDESVCQKGLFYLKLFFSNLPMLLTKAITHLPALPAPVQRPCVPHNRLICHPCPGTEASWFCPNNYMAYILSLFSAHYHLWPLWAVWRLKAHQHHHQQPQEDLFAISSPSLPRPAITPTPSCCSTIPNSMFPSTALLISDIQEGDNRGQDGWRASPTQWTWVWASSGRWWWTGKPGILQSMGLQRVRHYWATEQQQLCAPETSTSVFFHKVSNPLISWAGENCPFWIPPEHLLEIYYTTCEEEDHPFTVEPAAF